MKICLVNPQAPLRDDWKGNVEVYQPLGLAYVAAMLEKAGHEIVILDALAESFKTIHELEGRNYAGLSYEELSERIRGLSPDVVGITTVTSKKWSALKVAMAAKNADRKIKVMMGGPHISVRPEDCLSDKNVDFVIIGEGEFSTVELIDALENGKDISEIKGIGYKAGNELVINERRPLIQDLNSLPIPARHLFPMEKYFDAARHAQTSRGTSKRWVNMITSRGCPYNCIFCSIHLSMGRAWRFRTPENVIEEIESLVSKYGIEQINFEDDNMSLNRDRMEKICDLLISRNIRINWNCPNGLRADTLDEDLLRKMKTAGCTDIFVAAESGVQDVVTNIVGKNLDLSSVENAVVLCKKIGIRVGCFFVLGFPGEKKKDMEKTIEFGNNLRKLGATSCSFYIACPYYGTRLYEEAKENNYLTCEDGDSIERGFLNNDAMIRTPDFIPKDVKALQQRAVKEQDARTMEQVTKSPSAMKYHLVCALRKFRNTPKSAFNYYIKRITGILAPD